MARLVKGTVLERAGRFYVQIKFGKGNRPALPLATCTTREEADTRVVVLAELVRRLRSAGYETHVERTANEAAAATLERLASILRVVESLIAGKETPADSPFKTSRKTTIRELGEAWTGGELHRAFPDHVPVKTTADDDKWRLEKHVYPIVGPIELGHFTLENAQEVMRKLPAELSPASRRHIAQLLHRLLKLAVYPCRIRCPRASCHAWAPRRRCPTSTRRRTPRSSRAERSRSVTAWRMACSRARACAPASSRGSPSAISIPISSAAR